TGFMYLTGTGESSWKTRENGYVPEFFDYKAFGYVEVISLPVLSCRKVNMPLSDITQPMK
ncbi:MAG TPA: hypothetical protein VIL05_13850, partial [Thermoclostridium sp.]